MRASKNSISLRKPLKGKKNNAVNAAKAFSSNTIEIIFLITPDMRLFDDGHDR